jgi:hypothetical protein
MLHSAIVECIKRGGIDSREHYPTPFSRHKKRPENPKKAQKTLKKHPKDPICRINSIQRGKTKNL